MHVRFVIPYISGAAGTSRCVWSLKVVKNLHLTVLRLVDRLGGREPVVLIPLLLIVLGTWGFINIAEEVVEGDTHRFDQWVLTALREQGDLHDPLGPAWVLAVAHDITALGGTALLLFFTAAIAGYLWLDGKRRFMLLLVAASLSGLVVSSALKSGFQRPRPDVVPHLTDVMTTSFPSGHSLMSAVVYLTLGALLSSVVRRRTLKIYVLALSILLTVAVGISRIYLGVHYPTDVLAGWSVGLSWALLCWLIAHWLQRNRQVESAAAPIAKAQT